MPKNIIYKNRYYKLTYDEGQKGVILMSGLPLPDPTYAKEYHFIGCDIHPALWSTMREMYKESEFTDTYIGPPSI